MTVILSNLVSSAAYKPAQIAANPAKTESLSTENQPTLNNVADSAFEPDVLMQNVLQSLKSLGVQGVNTYSQELSPPASEALHSFVKELYQSINPEMPREALPVETVPNAETNNNPFLIGGTNFKYAVDLSGAELGDYLTDVKTNLKTALENIGEYISSKVVFNLKVVTENVEGNQLASANSTMITSRSNGEESADTSFISDSIYGVELSPEIPDSKLYINLAKIADMSFSGKPEPDKYDFTTILTHEILHGIAFSGMLNNTDSPLKTGFDELVTMTESGPIFTGKHARTENNGNSVPLAPESAGQGSSFYHVDIPTDLMATSIKKGEVKKISPLDVAMLQDMGVGIANANMVNVNNSSKVQNAYGKPSVNLQNLINTIQQTDDLEKNFGNLVQTLDGNNAYLDVNLHDFLSQLATTTQNESEYQSPVGSLVSLNA